MRFTLPLASDTTAMFDLPEADIAHDDYAALADEAYDLEDTDPEAARVAYDRALRVAVDELGADVAAYDPLVVQDIAAMLYNRGGVRFDLDDLEGSLEDLDASLAVATAAGAEGEERAEVLVRRAEARFALADIDGAFDDLAAALDTHPEHALAFNNRAVYHAELGHTDEAFADLERALAIEPDNALFHVTHAELLVTQGDEDAALTALETALEVDEDAAMLLDADVFDPIRKHPRFAALG